MLSINIFYSSENRKLFFFFFKYEITLEQLSFLHYVKKFLYGLTMHLLVTSPQKNLFQSH